VKKLKLRSEVVRALSVDNLRGVAGGLNSGDSECGGSSTVSVQCNSAGGGCTNVECHVYTRACWTTGTIVGGG
jgi:hypothetical protein